MAQKFLFRNMAQWFIFFLFSCYSLDDQLLVICNFSTRHETNRWYTLKEKLWFGLWAGEVEISDCEKKDVWDGVNCGYQWCEISIDRSKCNWNNHIISVLWKRDLCAGCVNVNGEFDHTMIAKSLKMSLEMFFLTWDSVITIQVKSFLRNDDFMICKVHIRNINFD